MSQFQFCFLFGPGRCGIKLLLSLLDNHREVVALPFTVKLYHYFKDEKFTINFNDLIKIIEDKTRFKLLKDNIKNNNSTISRNDYSLYDHDIFCNELKKLVSEKKTFTRKEIIENIYISYALAIKKDLKKVKYFIIDATYHDYLDKINFDFKNFKSIYLIRDPREQLLSLLKLHHKINHSLYVRGKMNYLTDSIFSQKENYKLLEKLQNKNYENLTIKFENLKKNPNNIMQEIANFLEIDFIEELIKPTLFGKIRSFETAFSKDPIIGLGKNNTNRLKIYLNKYQIIQFEMIFYDYIRKFNYSPTYYENTFLIKLIVYVQPFKFEILPSLDSLNNNFNVTKYKNYFFYKLLKYIFYCLYNFICYFVNRFMNLNYLKFYKN